MNISHQSLRIARRRSRGQSMMIFALIMVVLLGIVGLSVDAGNSLNIGEQERRAAQAGALAGVTYLPGDITDGTNAAKVEAARNNYFDGAPDGRNVHVTVTQPAGTNDQLTVTIQQDVNTTFLALFGFGKHTVVQKATAQFLPPISLGQSGSQLGTDQADLGTPGNYYVLRNEGFGVSRSFGDPFDTNPADPADTGAPWASSPADVHRLSSDNSSDTVDGSLPAYGGYNYLVYVPPGVSARVDAYNPVFSPDELCPAYNCLHENSSKDTYSTDTADYFGSIRYTFFKVNNQYHYNSDVEIGHVTFRGIDASHLNDGTSPTNWDWFDNSGTRHHVTSYTPDFFHNWVNLGEYTPSTAHEGNTIISQTKLSAGALGSQYLLGGASGQFYRIRIDSLDWTGGNPSGAGTTVPTFKHSYALRLMELDPGPVFNPCASPCSLGAMNDMMVYTPAPTAATNFEIPLFSVPPAYAGQTLQFYAFDPGDNTMTGSIQIIQPAYPNHNVTGTVASILDSQDLGNEYLNSSGTSITPNTPGKADITIGSCSGSSNGCFKGSYFNGHWLRLTVQIPPDYNPATPAYWDLLYVVNTGQAQDNVTFQVVPTGGLPVHLLP